MNERDRNIPRLRRVANGIYTTCPRTADPIKGLDIVIERHSCCYPYTPPRPVTGQRHWWTWKISGGFTDGIAYHQRIDALMAATFYATDVGEVRA